MSAVARPYRSVLYIPGSKPRALEKALGMPVDAIIFDLEDAVTPDEKINARNTLADTLARNDYGPRARLVRVNGLDSDWGRDDISAFVGTDIDGILVPKVNIGADIDTVAGLIPDAPIWAMMETTQSILNAAEIAAHPRLAGFVMGTNDLAKELMCRTPVDRAPMMTALQMCVLAARAHGVTCIDGVYNAFKDDAGLHRECEQGRDLGFDGKSLIHPAQVEIANNVFAPDADDIALANRQIAAFQDAQASGQGVAVLDGKIVENLHIVTAKAILAKAAAVKAMEQ